jgi:nucleotide-binding universal stress UspA family protein
MTAARDPEVSPHALDPSRILIAVHGYEPDGWARDPCRAVPPARTIAKHAAEWLADVVIVGRDSRSRPMRTRLGTVNERVVRLEPCAGLVTPTAGPAGDRVGVDGRAAVQRARG